jgi:hypothetical protein
MKLLIAILVIALIAGSLYADYRWRRWIDARRSEHNTPPPR